MIMIACYKTRGFQGEIFCLGPKCLWTTLFIFFRSVKNAVQFKRTTRTKDCSENR